MSLSIYILYVIGIGYLLQIITGGAITEILQFDPYLALNEPWRFITPIFVHGGVIHLLFNAYALFLFGPIVERKLTKKEFLMLFFLGGIVASLAYYATIILGIGLPVPAVGASGAIYAILGAAAVLYPEMTIFIWFFPMKMKYAVIFWVITQSLGTFDVSSGVASAAHLGGLIFGYLFTKQLISSIDSFDEWE